MHTGSGFPSVVGFDLPGLQDGPGPSRVIVSALLDTTPGDDWMRVLDRLAWPALRLDHGVEQLRLVGQGIHFVGDIRDGRGLSAAVRELFDLVTAKVLSARMAALEHPVDDLALASPPLAPMLVSQDPRLADVAALLQLPALPALLELASRLTGMRFVAVARVTDERWTACAVHDLLGFGLTGPGPRAGNHHLRRDPPAPPHGAVRPCQCPPGVLHPSHAGDVRFRKLPVGADVQA